MKIRFSSEKERNPTQEQGLKVLYAPGKRTAFRLRWYLILLLVASPLLWLAVQLGYGFWLVKAPAQLRLPTVELRAREAARVAEVQVEPGQRVVAGQPLLRLDSPEWRARLAQLEALDQAGDSGKAPGSEREEQLLQLQVQRAEQRLQRFQTLLAQGAATRAEVQTAQDQRDAQELQLLAFRRERRLSAERSPAENRELIQRESEQHWLESRLDELELRAPENGQVAEVLVNPGENVGPGTVLMRLTGAGEPQLWIYLEPRHGHYAAPGQAFEVRLPDGRMLSGRVVQQTDSVRRLPSDLRSPFSATQMGLVVAAQLDQPLPGSWRIDQLPLEVHFAKDWRHWLGWDD